MITSSPAIVFENVVQQFRLIRERKITLREAFARMRWRVSAHQEFEALKRVSFRIAKGEVVGIIGRNGSGKSTILKIIAGVYQPTAGRVEVSGTVAPLIELGAGFHAELTGRENIVLGGLLLGLRREQIAVRLERIIEFADLGDFIDSPVRQYSSGMFMRLAFALTSEIDADILLVDEILSVGDTAFQRKCLERMERLIGEGRTVLFVSHDCSTIARLCRRVLLVHKGSIVADGSPAEVIQRYSECIESLAVSRSA